MELRSRKIRSQIFSAKYLSNQEVALLLSLVACCWLLEVSWNSSLVTLFPVLSLELSVSPVFFFLVSKFLTDS